MGLLFGMILYPVISETKRHKMIVWSLRIAAIPLTVILFVVLIRNFYKSDPYAGESLRASMVGNTKPSLFRSLFLVQVLILLPYLF